MLKKILCLLIFLLLTASSANAEGIIPVMMLFDDNDYSEIREYLISDENSEILIKRYVRESSGTICEKNVLTTGYDIPVKRYVRESSGTICEKNVSTTGYDIPVKRYVRESSGTICEKNISTTGYDIPVKRYVKS